MKQINYASLPRNDIRRSYTTPLIAVVCGVLAITIMLIGPLLFPVLLLQLDGLVTLVGLVLFGVFIILLHRYFYETQIARDRLLRAFAKDNDFSFHSYKPSIGMGRIPDFTSHSSLLSPGYRLTPRSNMKLEGVYAGIDFSVTIVGMYWSRPGNRAGVSFYAVIRIHSGKLQMLPHIVALSKTSGRLLSSLNADLVKDGAWQQFTLGWEANARYDIYAYANNTLNVGQGDTFSMMLAEIHTLSGSDIEVNKGEMYIIDIGGIDYTQEGLQTVFNKIAIAAKYL